MNEFKDKMLQLLTAVDDVQAREAALQTERKRHQDQIAQSEGDLRRTEGDIEQCREAALGLKGELTELRDAIFARPETEEVLAVDEAHDPSADAPSSESEGRRMWKERQRLLKTV